MFPIFTAVEAIGHGLHKIGYISLRPDAETPTLKMPKYKDFKTKALMWAMSCGGQVMFLGRQYGTQRWIKYEGELAEDEIHPGTHLTRTRAQ